MHLLVADIVDGFNCVMSCLVCQRSKTLNSRPHGLVQPLPIPKGQWSSISMDVITSLPTTGRHENCILVFVDLFSKTVHFIPVEESMTAIDFARYFIERVVRLHGLHKKYFVIEIQNKISRKRCLQDWDRR